jgi:hypothetical protein
MEVLFDLKGALSAWGARFFVVQDGDGTFASRPHQ